MCPVKSFMSAGDQQSDHLVDHEGHVLVKKALQLLGSLARRSSLHGSMDVPQRASRLSPFSQASLSVLRLFSLVGSGKKLYPCNGS